MAAEWIGGIASAVGVVIGMTIYQSRQAKKNAALGERITAALREKGESTLKEIADALGMPGFYARGKVTLALNQMQLENAVEAIPAPEGTPALKKVDFIRYKLRA